MLADHGALASLAERQAKVVKAQHSYTARATSLLDILARHVSKNLRIDILTAVPGKADENLWGDWNFAQGLARSFRRQGHAVRVRKLGEKPDRATDVVIGLRGLPSNDPSWLNQRVSRIQRQLCRQSWALGQLPNMQH